MIGELTGLFAVLFTLGVPGLWILGKTPLGQALVHRLTYGADTPQLLGELDELRARLAEVEDRLEFAERQLTAAGREQSALKPVP